MNEIEQYDYDLPRELIAQDPVATRSDSRLMLVERKTGHIEHMHVRDLPDVLDARDTVVFNNSRVMPARLVGFRKDTGGRWQGLFLRADPVAGIWEVLTKTRGTLKAGERITVQDRDARDGMELEVVARTDGGNLLVKPHLPDGFVDLEGGSEKELVEKRLRSALPAALQDIPLRLDVARHYHRPSARLPAGGQNWLLTPGYTEPVELMDDELFRTLPVSFLIFRVYSHSHSHDADINAALESILGAASDSKTNM